MWPNFGKKPDIRFCYKKGRACSKGGVSLKEERDWLVNKRATRKGREKAAYYIRTFVLM